MTNKTSLNRYRALRFIGAMLGLSVVLWIPYLLLRRSPRRWWLYAGLASLPISTLMLVITPIWVDPLFNRYESLKDQALESRVLALAGRAGIKGSRVYEVDKSRDTKKVNAYVTGVGQTKRIVLWYTLVDKLEPEQVLFVTAHEATRMPIGLPRNSATTIAYISEEAVASTSETPARGTPALASANSGITP